MGNLDQRSLGDRRATERGRLAELLHRAARYLDAHLPRAGVAPARAAVELARLVGDRPRLAHALALLGGHYRLAGETYRAVPVLLEGAELAAEHGEQSIHAACLSDLGYLALMSGELADAYAYLDRSLAVRRAIGDVVGEAQCLDYLAFTLYEEGEQAPAEDLLDRAHRLRLDHGDPRWVAVSLN